MLQLRLNGLAEQHNAIYSQDNDSLGVWQGKKKVYCIILILEGNSANVRTHEGKSICLFLI